MIRLYDMASGDLLRSEREGTTTTRTPEQQQTRKYIPAIQLQEILLEPERRPFGLPPDLVEKSVDLFIDEQ